MAENGDNGGNEIDDQDEQQRLWQEENERLQGEVELLQAAINGRLREQLGLLQQEEVRLQRETQRLMDEYDNLETENERRQQQNEERSADILALTDPRLDALLNRGDNGEEETDLQKMKILLELSNSIETRLNTEGGWVNNRMNYLLVSQAFLITAMTVAATSQVNLAFLKRVIWTVLGLSVAHILAVFFATISAECTVSSLLSLRGIVDSQIRHYGSLNWPILGLDPRVPPQAWQTWLVRKNTLFVHGTVWGLSVNVVIPLSLLGAWVAVAGFLGTQDVFEDTCIVGTKC